MSRRRYYRKRYYGRQEDPLAELIALIVVCVLIYFGYLFYTNRTRFLQISTSIIVITVLITGAVIWGRMYTRRKKNNYQSSDPLFIPFANTPSSLSKPTAGRRQAEAVSTEEKQVPKYELKPLLTPTEEKFLTVLKKVVGNRYRIIPQMPLSQILHVRNSNKNYTNYHDFNIIAAKTVDFGLCDDNLKPRVVIELDDYTHSRPDRRERDKFVDEILKEVGLKIIHVPVSDNYDEESVTALIFMTDTNAVGA